MNLPEGKIDSNGQLYIKRGSTLKVAACTHSGLEFCSDACSKFGQPTATPPYTLFLCGDTLTFTVFTDERT